jgi:hypothetical protein
VARVAAPRPAAVGVLLVLLALLAACGGSDPEPRQPGDDVSLAATIVQLRRDQVLQRVEVALENTGRSDVVVERLRLTVKGFAPAPAVPKDSPIPAGQVVNLPWTYGTPRCGPDGAPDVGRPTVTVQVRAGAGQEPRTVRLGADDEAGLMRAIAVRACRVQQVSREVELAFGPDWRLERGDGGQDSLHGTLEARLLVDEPRDVTQVAGAIMYGLQPDDSAGSVPDPLARLTLADPSASIPVRAYAARCDPHTIGEIKKPYEFLVWVAVPGEEPFAVTPQVGDATKVALRKVCAF